MNGSLSQSAQPVMEHARCEVLRLHHEYLGTEHILLGIATEHAGIAADVFASTGITVERIRLALAPIVEIGPPSASPDDRRVTPSATRVLGFAHEEAALCGSSQVEPEHLLLGITREVQGVAAQVLRNLEVPPEVVREQLLSRLLGRGNAGEPQDD
jgi:ATP-dependent Clp protease ATP-binding subunit ClpC